MQRMFSVIVIFAMLIGGGGYLYTQKAEEEAKQKLAEDRKSARRTFADKARAAVRSEDDDAYLRGVQAALKAFDDELEKNVYTKNPKWRDPAAYEKEATRQFQEGEIKEVQHKSMIEGYKIVREAYDTIMGGNWKPVLTAQGKGETRLDIYQMNRTRDDEGNPILEGKFFFWGIEDSTRMTWGSLALRYWTKRMKQVKKGRRKVEEEVEEVLGRAEGDSQPTIFIQNPHNYVADFPSYVAIGTIWLPVMPRDATMVDIEYGYTAKIGGASVDSMLTWEKFNIPPSWQLKDGEVWDADVIEATEDEIAGRDPNEVEGEEASPQQ